MRAELGVELADLLDRLADPALRRDPGALGRSTGATDATAESDRTRQLLEQRFVLVADRLGARDITAVLCVLELVGERGETLLEAVRALSSSSSPASPASVSDSPATSSSEWISTCGFATSRESSCMPRRFGASRVRSPIVITHDEPCGAIVHAKAACGAAIGVGAAVGAGTGGLAAALDEPVDAEACGIARGIVEMASGVRVARTRERAAVPVGSPRARDRGAVAGGHHERGFEVCAGTIEAPIESALAMTDGLAEAIDLRSRRRTRLLRADLRGLGIASTRDIAMFRSVSRFQSTCEALGWIFVVDRSALLHGVLQRHVAQLPNELAKATSYLANGGRGAGPRLRDLGIALDEVVHTPEMADQVIDAARQAFDQERIWFDAESAALDLTRTKAAT